MNLKIGRSVGKLGLTLRKNLPAILTFASAAGVVGSVVLTAKAAYKSVPKIEEHKDTMERLRANKDNFEDVKEYNREVVSVYKNTAIEMVKAYWPAALVTSLTMAAIFTNNSVNKKRYLTMVGMYSAMSTAYNEYRKRVADKYGEDAERDLYYNLKREEVVTVETGKNGKEKTKVEVVVSPQQVTDPNFSLYLIDPHDKCWFYRKPEMTLLYLQKTQEFLTQHLHARGYLFLNEVLRALDKPEVPEGQVIGWVYDENKAEGDNRVDFGLVPGTENYDFFMNGKNDFVYITLNHDGTIYDKFPSFDRLWKRDVTRRV